MLEESETIDISTNNVGIHRGIVVVHSCGIHGTHRVMDFSGMNSAASWAVICKAYGGCRDAAERDGWAAYWCEGGAYFVLNRPGMSRGYWCLAETWFAEQFLQRMQNEEAHNARR